VSFLLPIVLLLMNGCPFITSGGDGPTPPQPSPYKPQTSISNVLDNLTKSYTEMNYEEYVKLFADFTDAGYTYIFDPRDIGGPHNNPPSWGLAEEKVSAQHLFSKTDANFEGYVAVSTSLTFARGSEIPNDMETWTKVVLSQIFLTVNTRQKDTRDPLDYLVQGDQANLWFVQNGAYWYIVRWEDQPFGGSPAMRPLVASD
jgi:hypothetical protein